MRLCLVNINDALWCPEISIPQITLVQGRVVRVGLLVHECLFENKYYTTEFIIDAT